MIEVFLCVCFELGRALRQGDAGAFFEVYDGFLKKQTVAVDKLKLNVVKEFARQISELAQEDFVLMHTSFLTSSAAKTMLVQLTEPVDVQLTACLEKLRADTVLCTSDSGAVSDFDGSSVSCEDLSSTSTTTLEDVFTTKPEILEEENKSTVRGGLTEEDNAIVTTYGDQAESLSDQNGVQLPQVSDTHENYHQQLNVRRKTPLARGRYNVGTAKQGGEHQWKSGTRYKFDHVPHGYGRGKRVPQRPKRSSYSNEHGRREKHHQKAVSTSHEQMALFLWKGWQQAQKELAVN